ncbi:MAG: zinc-dependent metalloprotease [Arthrobacter sp.]
MESTARESAPTLSPATQSNQAAQPNQSGQSNQSSQSNQAQALINWDLAASAAARLAPAGPVLDGKAIGDAVDSLRRLADASVPHVHEITGLEAARDLRDSSVLVVDRASWAKANTQSFAVMLKPAMQKMLDTRRGNLSPAAAQVSGAITGSQLGAVLAFLSSKVLGQYDPFAALAENSTAPAAGRLLLVAPNIVSVERELNVAPEDFRLWVCLHEQTHRVQFAAAPWLRHHMLEQIDELSGHLLGNVDSLMERASAAARSLKDRSASGNTPGRGAILDLLQDPEEKAAISHLTAVMSLLEGHANVVMDAVDASIVPSVKTIRQRFNDRGKDRGVIEKFIRSLLGLDAKMRQYSDGARFVRAVVDVAGMEGFNKVWDSVDHLPTEPEIHDAKLWLDRMGL